MISIIRLLILADDFTGALDTGVQLTSFGAKVLVLPAPPETLAARSREAEVLVVDTESRHLPHREAYRIIEKIVRQAVDLGIPHIYKKTDSALRGNVGAELTALLDASGEEQLPFLPAFPQMGRTTVGGVHYIEGTPVSESVFGADPFDPVRHSDVAEIIGEQSPLPVYSVRPGEGSGTPGKAIVVYDAASVADLEVTGRALARRGSTRILAGCAGFGAILPRLLGFEGGTPAPVPPLPEGLLVVCGSVNPITLAQLDRAEAEGFARLRLTPEQKLTPGYWQTGEGRCGAAELRKALEAHPRVILDSNDPGGNRLTAAAARDRGMTQEQVRVAVSQSLGQLLKALFPCPSLGTVLITGGDTLLQCMDALSVTQLEPLGELAPGVVLSRFVHGSRTRYLISKSGGFGPPTLLTELAHRAAPSPSPHP